MSGLSQSLVQPMTRGASLHAYSLLEQASQFASKTRILTHSPLSPPLVINELFFSFLRLTPEGIQQGRAEILPDSAQVINVDGTEFSLQTRLQSLAAKKKP